MSIKIRILHPSHRSYYLPGDILRGVVVVQAREEMVEVSVVLQGMMMNADQRSIGVNGGVYYEQVNVVWRKEDEEGERAAVAAYPTPPLGPHDKGGTTYRRASMESMGKRMFPFQVAFPRGEMGYLPSSFEGKAAAPSFRYHVVAVVKRTKSWSGSATSLHRTGNGTHLPDIVACRKIRFRAFIDADSPEFNRAITDKAFLGPSVLQWLARGKASSAATAMMGVEDGLPVSATLSRTAFCPGDTITIRLRFGDETFEDVSNVVPLVAPQMRVQLGWKYTSPTRIIGMVASTKEVEKGVVLDRHLALSKDRPMASVMVIHVPLPRKMPVSEMGPPDASYISFVPGQHRVSYTLKMEIVIGGLKAQLRLPVTIASHGGVVSDTPRGYLPLNMPLRTGVDEATGSMLTEEWLPEYDAESAPPTYAVNDHDESDGEEDDMEE